MRDRILEYMALRSTRLRYLRMHSRLLRHTRVHSNFRGTKTAQYRFLAHAYKCVQNRSVLLKMCKRILQYMQLRRALLRYLRMLSTLIRHIRVHSILPWYFDCALELYGQNWKVYAQALYCAPRTSRNGTVHLYVLQKSTVHA